MEDAKNIYIYVLDYSDCTIYEIETTDNDDLDIENILEAHGINTNTASWMISDNKIYQIIELP